MGKVMLLAVLLAGCVTEQADGDASSTLRGASGETDGWGEWCDNTLTVADPYLYKTCHNGVTGDEGICDFSICRRWCSNPGNGTGCPRGFHSVPIQGNGCFCEPDLDQWVNPQVSPAMDWNQ